MNRLLLASDKFLSFIPGDGLKTSLGLGLKLALPVLVVQFPFLLAVAPALDGLADTAIALGLLHKVVKVTPAVEEAREVKE